MGHEVDALRLGEQAHARQDELIEHALGSRGPLKRSVTSENVPPACSKISDMERAKSGV